MDTYAPAHERVVGYLKGGKAREKVVASAAARGTISVRDVTALDAYIRWWVTRVMIHAQPKGLQDGYVDGEDLALEVSACVSPTTK